MDLESLLGEPDRVDEPREAQAYSDVLSEVASGGKPVIVRRNGEDLAAVIPLGDLAVVRDIVSRQELERRASQIDWERARRELRPPQSWFDDPDNPFVPEG